MHILSSAIKNIDISEIIKAEEIGSGLPIRVWLNATYNVHNFPILLYESDFAQTFTGMFFKVFLLLKKPIKVFTHFIVHGPFVKHHAFTMRQ